MVEAGNPEAMWTVQAVDPIEIHMMVTVRYDCIRVLMSDNHCGTKKEELHEITNQFKPLTIAISSHKKLPFVFSLEETAFQADS